MIIMMKRSFALAFVSVSIVSHPAFAADEWQPIKVNGHDYLTVENIAKFYGLPAEVTAPGGKIQIETVKHPLEFVRGSREVVINGARSWLCFPLIEQNGKFLVSRTDVAKTIEPLVRPQRVQNVGKVQTVVLDPGHGGHDKGAVSRYGNEKDFALDVARKLRPLLQAKGLRVVMTREGDYFVPLDVRAQIANAARDSIFVSIHFNATDRNPNATGFEIFSFTPRGAPSTSDNAVAPSSLSMQAGTLVDSQSLALSACVYHSLLGHIPEFDRGIKRARFAVLRQTKVPAVLIEGGFLTERGESRLIANKDWRTKLAGAISVGIENYQALAIKNQPPMLVADYRRQGPSKTLAPEQSPPPLPPPWQRPQISQPTSLESAVIVP
ncbi:MAG: N-acetylmuramoyl-L-alanine amidase [Verrucomicrobia bacterium]|nr:MAG: N-acetylmuramoyl-L-alanine amidase [Verrucomicrobiota bacterium]